MTANSAVNIGIPLSDPAGGSALVAVVHWLEGTLLGTIATTVAVIAVASIGFAALSGRVEIRRVLTVVGGCFILFGASSIVAGIQGVLSGGDATFSAPPVMAADTSPLAALPYDPYAGAAVPTH